MKGLLEAGPAWTEAFVSSGSDNPFLTWEWAVSWASRYAADEAIHVLLAETGGRTVAVIPLFARHPRVRMLADPLFADYAEPLLLGEAAVAALPALLRECLKLGRRIEFGPLRGCSPAAPALRAAADALDQPWASELICSNPTVIPDGDFDSYMGRRAKRLRQEIRTTVNHLNRGGGWSYREVQQGEPGEDGILDALIDFHTFRQDGKVGHSIFDLESNRHFFRRLPGDLANSPVRTHLSAIVWQGRVVSAAYSLVCGGTFFYWIPSFDQSIQSVSLGKLHIKCLMENCFANNLIFDFMGGDEPYKLQWAETTYDVLRLNVYSNDLGKSLAVFAEAALRAARRAKRRSPALTRLWKALSKLRMDVPREGK